MDGPPQRVRNFHRNLCSHLGKYFDETELMKNSTTIDAKIDFQTIHVKEFQSFPKHYLKDLNCHKVGGGRAARRRRRKNVACFSKCRK